MCYNCERTAESVSVPRIVEELKRRNYGMTRQQDFELNADFELGGVQCRSTWHQRREPREKRNAWSKALAVLKSNMGSIKNGGDIKFWGTNCRKLVPDRSCTLQSIEPRTSEENISGLKGALRRKLITPYCVESQLQIDGTLRSVNSATETLMVIPSPDTGVRKKNSGTTMDVQHTAENVENEESPVVDLKSSRLGRSRVWITISMMLDNAQEDVHVIRLSRGTKLEDMNRGLGEASMPSEEKSLR
ncbi:hypothetical protein B0H17DRAFT_1148029 [Mycena rosella]|uniref:Uncharacterized protein n=1 Tax=Mycena rosella TaxID=1033263 RepID=A0AAD7G1C1_MYCRO|nr:hypothetical protein B0H17DRAFT_1148029 [Mycena rosella]